MKSIGKSKGHKFKKCAWFIAFAAWSLNTDAIAAQKLEVDEDNKTLSVRKGDQVVLVYNKKSPEVPEGIDEIYRRSGCMHPIMTPNGRVVTDMFPKDHPHQHGIFTAWVKTKFDGRSVDFWNLADRTGRVLHERLVSVEENDEGVHFEVDLLHRIMEEPQVDVLRERWRVTAFATDGSYNCFDLELRQTALTDTPLVVQKHHYGGFAVRGRKEWLTAGDKYQDEQDVREASSFLNDLGSNRVQGNHQHCKWVAMTGNLAGQSATIAVLNHPNNFRSPQAVRLHPTKPYFAYSPCVDGSLQIDRQNPYLARYRILVVDSSPDSEWLSQQWSRFSIE